MDNNSSGKQAEHRTHGRLKMISEASDSDGNAAAEHQLTDGELQQTDC